MKTTSLTVTILLLTLTLLQCGEKKNNNSLNQGYQKKVPVPSKPVNNPSWYFNQLIEAKELNQLIQEGKPHLIVDSRTLQEFQQGHLPGAIQIGTTEMDQTNKLPNDKSKLIILYCRGYNCSLSHTAANIAVKRGYTNVKVYAGGYPEWAMLGYPIITN